MAFGYKNPFRMKFNNLTGEIIMTPELAKLREQPHWSFSSLNGFVNICSLQWAFKYIDKKEKECSSVNLRLGSAFHKAAEWLARGRMKGEYPKVEKLQDVFSEAWKWEYKADDQLHLSDDDFNQHDATGRKMVDALNQNWLEDDILGVSTAFCVPLPGVSKPLIGEIDLIVRNDNGDPVLVDWKTAAKKWAAGKADKDMQATCFSYAWQQQSGSIPEFRYDVVTKTKEPSYIQHPTQRTEDDFARMIHLMQAVEKAVNAESFLPNEAGYYCKSCEYASACKAWHHQQSRTLFLPLAA
jgi:Holliday junction resolvase-like predicted endonuclease